MVKKDLSFWKGRKVLVTGHTGFKGSWLSIWLKYLGAEVLGYSLDPPSKPSLFKEAKLDNHINSVISDINDLEMLETSFRSFKPEIVFHLAAQPLVRDSYRNPVETYHTNVIGTLNIFEVVRITNSVKSIIIVTTDKCYENLGLDKAYVETDPMGGFDPYSSSKACVEILTKSYSQSFFDTKKIGIASVRAGNVIGGGDWAKDRLIPDVIRSFDSNQTLMIRYPHSTRPWQHVLEPLYGYLLLAENLYFSAEKYSGAWNFGPENSDAISVEELVEKISQFWKSSNWIIDKSDNPHESSFLRLDINKAKSRLNWYPRWNIDIAISKILSFHEGWKNGKDAYQLCLEQIKEFNIN